MIRPATTRCSAVLLTCLFLTSLPTQAQERHTACDTPEAHQFDFWAGEWDVQSRVRTPDGSWRETQQTWTAQEVIGGCAFLDFADGNFSGTPMKGMGTRYYNPANNKWYITWLSTNAPGQWGTWEGGFDDDGRGDFIQEVEGPNGTVLSRISWTDVTPDSAHWEHAVSSDRGSTWQTTWVMDFTRKGSQ